MTKAEIYADAFQRGRAFENRLLAEYFAGNTTEALFQLCQALGYKGCLCRAESERSFLDER